MKKILILTLFVVATGVFALTGIKRGEMVNDMTKSIDHSEAFLDSLDTWMPFMDTVGEGDDYYYLCEAKREFDDAKADCNVDRMFNAFQVYNMYYKRCVNQATAILIQQKEWENELFSQMKKKQQCSMKKYNVFKVLGGNWSPILKYSTNEYDDAIQMAKLLKKEDEKYEYVVLTPVEQ